MHRRITVIALALILTILTLALTALASGGPGSATGVWRPPMSGEFAHRHIACTATHVGNGIVISAGHCFGAGATRENDTPCSGGYVYFGYIAGAAGTRSSCTTVPSGGVEYSVIIRSDRKFHPISG